MNHLRRLLLTWLCTLTALTAAGCATTAGVKEIQKAAEPLETTGLRIVYVAREMKIKSTHPYFDKVDLPGTVAEIGESVMERLPVGLSKAGIETRTLTVKTDEAGVLTDEAQSWLQTTRPEWPVLFVVPAGGTVSCNPCYIKLDAVMDLRIPARPRSSYWTAQVQQPAMTSGMAVGTRAMHLHFADEMVRVLLLNVRGPKAI